MNLLYKLINIAACLIIIATILWSIYKNYNEWFVFSCIFIVPIGLYFTSRLTEYIGKNKKL